MPPLIAPPTPPPRSSAVLPRRVCIYIDGTQGAFAAFQWSMWHLLSPDIDDIHLLCSLRKRNLEDSLRAVSSGGREVSPTYADVAASADICEELCIKKGFNVTKLHLGAAKDAMRGRSVGSTPRAHAPPPASSTAATRTPSASPSSSPPAQGGPLTLDGLLREALRHNCDLLVVSRASGGCYAGIPQPPSPNPQPPTPKAQNPRLLGDAGAGVGWLVKSRRRECERRACGKTLLAACLVAKP
jgi:hypothetical protein